MDVNGAPVEVMALGPLASSDIHEPIPEMSRKAAVDEAAEAVGLSGTPDDRGNVGERGARDPTGGERVRTQVEAAAAHQGLGGPGATHLKACKGVTHVGHHSERRGKSPGERALKRVGLVHGMLEKPFPRSEPEEGVVAANAGPSGAGRSSPISLVSASWSWIRMRSVAGGILRLRAQARRRSRCREPRAVNRPASGAQASRR